MDADELDRRYIDHVGGVIGSHAAQVEVILPDRRRSSNRTAIAGWWVDEAASDGRIVLPNPYDSVEAIAAMEAWVWSVVQRITPRLGKRLDELSGRPPQPPAYWRMVLTPWLVHLTSALADRRLFCRAVQEAAPDALMLVPALPGPPAATADALKRLRTDEGNAGLFAALAPLLDLRTRPGNPDADGVRPVARPAPGPRRQELVREIPRAATSIALARLPARRVALVGLTRLRVTDLLRLESRVHGLAPLPRPVLSRSPLAVPVADPAVRAGLSWPPAEDPLEQLVLSLMPDLLPRSMLEGFDAVQRESARRYGGVPLAALVGNYSVDEVQNEFLGRSRAAGHRLVFAQHGGFYLQSLVNSQERLEIEPDSTFLSWGGEGRGVIAAPNPHLERLRGSHRGGTRITIVEALEPPDAFVVRFAGHPLANQGYETSRMLAEMVRQLPAGRRAQVALKRFPNPTGRPSRPEVLETLPCDGPQGGATAWMAASRLVVIPYLDTPFIEALVVGTPTVGLWNPDRWPVRPDVGPLFGRLRDVGIIHAEPASAAAHIDAVYDDVDSWWSRRDVIDARASFIQRFAIPGDWLRAWSACLRELAS